MSRSKLISLALLVAALVMASCRKDNNKDEDVVTYTVSTTNALVTSFKLKADDKVMTHLDSVHFSIDPVKRVIYNADSLPRGTNVSHLLTSVTFGSAVGTVNYYLTYTKNGVVQRDTIPYSNSSTDSLNMTGSCYLEVKSYDGNTVVRYDVRVNVHQVEPDTIQWPMTERRNLPGSADDNLKQRTVQGPDRLLCLLRTANDWRVSSATSVAAAWTTTAFAGGFEPQVESLAASSEAFYVLDNGGNLYRSTDGQAWTGTGVRWSAIIGDYGSRVLGITADETPMLDEYPRAAGHAPMALPADFPVRGMSQLVCIDNDWTISPQAVMVGGVLSDGSLSNKSWGYDGTTWAVVSAASDTLPALRDAILLSYFTYDINSTSLVLTKHPTWLLMGGFGADGQPNRTTFMSRNQGITWGKAPTGLQWPSHIPSMGGAQAIVESRTISVSQRARRVSRPVTEWECPYIYLFGGYDQSGVLLPYVWQGVLTRLMFQPLY